MWISAIIIVLCIQRSLTIETVNESGRIKKENYEPNDKKIPKDISIGQYYPLGTEYEDEDIGDSPDVDINKPSVERTEHEQKLKNSNISLPNLFQLQKLERLARSVLPVDKSRTSKIEEADSDSYEDDDEDTESSGSTEGQDDVELYDGVETKQRHKINGKAKRLTIRAKKGTISSFPEPIENGEDESLNENDGGEEYGEILPTRKEIMTVRTKNQKVSSKGLVYREIPSVSPRITKSRKFKGVSGFKESTDSIENKFVAGTTNRSVFHGRKGKTPRTKDKIKSAIRSGVENDFDDLKKAYNALVCSVENFMALANKTMKKASDDNCKLITTCGPVTTPSSVATYCVVVTTECVTTVCVDSELDSDDASKNDEEDRSIIRKKIKAGKGEYPTSDEAVEKSGGYVYNDYDGMDQDYDTNQPLKPSYFSIQVSRSRHLTSPQATTITEKNETSKETTRTVPSSTVTDSTTREASTVSSVVSASALTKDTVTWTTFRFDTKVRMKASRRQVRRMTSEMPKVVSRRKYHYNRVYSEPRDISKVMATNPDVTNVQKLKDLPSNRDGDTEVIEVEYV